MNVFVTGMLIGLLIGVCYGYFKARANFIEERQYTYRRLTEIKEYERKINERLEEGA